MALVTTTEMFKKAFEGKYSIGAFNINIFLLFFRLVTTFFVLAQTVKVIFFQIWN